MNVSIINKATTSVAAAVSTYPRVAHIVQSRRHPQTGSTHRIATLPENDRATVLGITCALERPLH